jgi:hypothetical protein
MVYAKALAVGIVSGLALAVAWFVVAVWIPFQNRPEGSNVAVSIGALEPTLIALVGFVVGFLWTVRRARRRRLSH